MSENKNIKNYKKPLWLILLLVYACIFISALIGFSFFLSNPKYTISTSIIILVCLLVVLVLSESFDSLSVGKILSVNKSSEFSIDKADENEIKLEQNKEYDVEKQIRKHVNNDEFNRMILEKHFDESINYKIQRDIKITEKFQDMDSISNKPVFFDAYLKEKNMETFIIIRRNPILSAIFHDILYVKINKLLAYKNSCNSEVCLLLLIAKSEGMIETKEIDYLQNYFKPAQAKKILEIKSVSYSDKEFESCVKTETKKK